MKACSVRSNKAFEPVVDVEGTCVSMQTEDVWVFLLGEVAALKFGAQC